ncbi:MAG: tetratricopeptide repeat protein [Alphaproteobacteria bacterium]
MRAVTSRAGAGQAASQLALGEMYAEGECVPENPAEALHWYLKAANQKLPEAMLKVGRCYAKGLGVDRNLERSLKWYHEAGAAGSMDAQHLLGTMYARGRSVPQDYEKSARWFLAAARSGDRRAELIYGQMLRDGRGVPKSTTKAYIWLLNATKTRAGGKVDPVLLKTLRELEMKLTPEEKKHADTVMDNILTHRVAVETAHQDTEKGTV